MKSINKNYDVIIVPTLYGFKNPSFITFDDGDTLLNKQIKIINKCFTNSNIHIIPAQPEVYDDVGYSRNNNIIISENISNFDSASVISSTIAASNASKVILLFNNMYITPAVFGNIPSKNSIFINNRKQGNQSVIINSNTVVNVFWNIGQEWSNILCIKTKKQIEQFTEILASCHERQFLFEGVNRSINRGMIFEPFKHTGKTVKITKRNDIKRI